ncbi:nuclear transcription factor Y subunit A-10-like, partial [Carica papaya]|uniref:nuclear transcription factor Y subunit A-10-like n=1 Tax=Carica papaya TaxID=3649 RepID=UPI000B8D01A0
MAMQTVYFKEHEGVVHNPTGQFSSVPQASRWGAFGSQSVYVEACGQFKSLSMENTAGGFQLAAAKQRGTCTDQGPDKGTVTPFTIFPGDRKNSAHGHKPQGTTAVQSALSDYHAGFELGFGQPMICAKYAYMDQCYGLFSAYAPQISGRIMLPLNLTTDDGPIYVNAKQYHGIIRRRQSRAKAVLENKATRSRKPYMHYSRHLHAMRRPRGCGGRFLNTKNLDSIKGATEVKNASEGKLYLLTGSQNSDSEVLQSDSGTLNSSKETNGIGSNLSGSEVTSLYSRRDIGHFSINHLGSSVRSFSSILDSGHSIVMPTKWVAAAD